jgi:hypothetical protein
MTTKKQAMKESIAASLTVIKALAPVDDAPDTISVLHLGHPSDPKFGKVESMTPAEYEKFVWLHTWPKPTLAARRALSASEAERRRVQGGTRE